MGCTSSAKIEANVDEASVRDVESVHHQSPRNIVPDDVHVKYVIFSAAQKICKQNQKLM